MDLSTLITLIADSAKDLITSIETRENLSPLGLRRSARLPVLASLHARLNKPILLITDRSDHALELFDELSLWSQEKPRNFYPEPNPLFYENTGWGETTRRDRLLVLSSLATYHLPGKSAYTLAPIVVAPVRAVMTRTLPRRDFIKATRVIRTGDPCNPDQFIRLWLSYGYEHVNTVITPGQFARRGGILDLWIPAENLPVRLELFGDEIETLRPFDPATQRTLTQRLDRLVVTPAREYILPLTSNVENENPEQDPISEFHIPLLHNQVASLLDYLPRDALILIDDHQNIQDTVSEIEEQAVSIRRDAIAEGTLSPDFPIPYLTWSDIDDTLSRYQVVELGPSFAPFDESPNSLAQRFSAGSRFAGQLKAFIDHLQETTALGEKSYIVSRQASRLEELWKERAHPSLDNQVASPQFIQGSLNDGWIFNQSTSTRVHLYTDGEIFGWRRPEVRQRQRRVVQAPEAIYADLQPGDLVVHVDHGIGVFIGLVHRTINGVEREFLCIEYADEAQLFVPVHQSDRVTRYVGPDHRTPVLSRLGGKEWHTAKKQVKEAVSEVAADLLDLYAQRNIVKGHAFKPDTPWQQELEASFPYIETEDQIRVLSEVKEDMQSPKPMDRLIAGDVGYGKTEVALRAAFKAISDGKQVAVLVPTTVLAQQHYMTFMERLTAFPVFVEMLSRFRTPQEQKRILAELGLGNVDIVIGTHRLLSPDVMFKDLGLLIIDEEQRFGVTHKEKLKKMRTEVDVLTLTATPIPRTLYMTLTGVRDISTINTPPEERLPIITHIGPYSQKLVRQAILRELERGGQIFFVHNRVQTIEAMRSHLERLVPESRITVAHGQMPEQLLSARMQQFTEGEVDILLSTSIIESGLDIPNANTLIVDRADTFGLAQLYQLRGRVGRGAQRGYAYFFRHKRKLPTYEGQQRLETIAENTQLGAGLSIAMRDLEIRGAGDLLGTRQHGHIAAIGFHLYTRLLGQAVRRQRKLVGLDSKPSSPALDAKEAILVNVDLPIPVHIPVDYVPDKGMRLRLYRRLANIHTLEEVDALVEEFNDRFGVPPEPVTNLFYQLRVKLIAEHSGLASITSENGQFVLRYPEGEIPDQFPDLGPLVRVGKTALWMPFKQLPDWRGSLMHLLTMLETATDQLR